MAKRSTSARRSRACPTKPAWLIPGARNPDQVHGNDASAALPPLRQDQLDGVRDVYDRLIRAHVHDRW